MKWRQRRGTSQERRKWMSGERFRMLVCKRMDHHAEARVDGAR